ncbi:MAG: hypothetical protein NTY05_08665 [Rhodocyclales bacterium]|nr:hypothetical protein [Rhodocyclales bacterium]
METGNAENVSQDQQIAGPPENIWLAGAFAVTSLIGVALYAGLLIRAVVIDGDIARALGGLLLSSLAAYAATTGRRPPAGIATLVVLTAISSSIAIAGFNSWDELVVAQRMAGLAPQHPNDVKLTDQAVELPIESPSASAPSVQSPPPTKSSNSATSNSRNMEPGFMAALVRQLSERQIQKATAHDSAVNRLGLDAVWEPENLLSPARLQEGRRKMTDYQALTSQMEKEHDAEIKRQNEKILSLAGARYLGEFKQRMASGRNDVKGIVLLQRAFAVTSIELLDFLDQQIRQQTSAFQDGMFEFANQADQDRYDFLIKQLEDQETRIADLQSRSIRRLNKDIEKVE